MAEAGEVASSRDLLGSLALPVGYVFHAQPDDPRGCTFDLRITFEDYSVQRMKVNTCETEYVEVHTYANRR
jgi:hypothetical protein